jgi:hypothetical protein
MTSASREQTVGRWRRDLPPDVAAAATEALREPLAAFGYET